MKNLVLTISIGDVYTKIADLTHFVLKAYANKISSDFLCINKLKISKSTSHWEKFQIFDLLEKYDRILFVDSDIIIRSDSPSLFDIVPKNAIGAFNEAPYVDRSRELMIDCCKDYGTKLSNWNQKYYNTGVMVISRRHKNLFIKPEKEYCSFYEQTYLNMRIAQEFSNDMFDLDYRFNRMTCMDRFTGEERHASYFIHYAGCPDLNTVIDLIPEDLDKWNKSEGKYEYKRHIYVSVSGGLGDQICAEPAIRFMKNKIYPNDDITIATHFPRIFNHLDVTVCKQGEFRPKDDTPYYITQSLPDPKSVMWTVVSNLLCHTVDFSSIALLKRTLPTFEKQVYLETTKTDIDSLCEYIDNPEECVLVHPGRHWQSKTLPTEYWQEIIDGLAYNNKVIIIGKEDGNRGTVNVKCPSTAIDLRNKLDLGETIALISKAKLLLSNDSAPVHIAGAFDNWIVLIPTCKHPDHVLPYRNNGNLYYKALALYKKLPIDEFDAKPTSVQGSSAEFIFSDWNSYLLEPSTVVEKIKNVLELNVVHVAFTEY